MVAFMAPASWQCLINDADGRRLSLADITMAEREHLSAVRELLRDTRCTALLKGQKIIEIDAADPIAKGCQVSGWGPWWTAH